jgi:hypothetical protein
MRSLQLSLFVLLSLSLPSSAARASGSVEVSVHARLHSLTVAQTFRKILAAGDAGEYYASVRKSFLALAARLGPRIDALLERQAKAAGLGTLELGLPTFPAEKPTGPYPALLRLAPVEVRGGRLALVVRIAFSRPPEARQIVELQRAIAALLRAHADREVPGTTEATEIAPLRDQRGQLLVELRPRGYATRAEANRLSAGLRSLAGKLRGSLEARLRQERGVTLGGFDPRLKPHESSKRLPGIITVQHHGEDLHLQASFVVRALASSEALATLRQDLARVLEAR